MHPGRKNALWLIAIFVIAAGQFVWDLIIPNGLTDWVWYTIPIFLSTQVGRRSFSYLLAALVSVLMLVAFYLSPQGIDPHLALEGRFIGMGAFWLMAWLIARQKGVEQDLRKSNRALRTISACNQILAHVTVETELLQEICQAIIEQGGHRMAWVGFAEEDEQKSVRCAASAGMDEGYLARARISWSEATERGRGPTGRAIRSGQIVICKNIQTDPTMIPWRREAERRQYASTVVLPLRKSEKAFGVLMIYGREPDAFNANEVEMLKELADNLAFGIHALRAQTERQLAEAAKLANERRLQFLLTNTPVIIYSLGAGKNFPTVFISPNVLEVLGHPPEAFTGDTEFWFAHLHPDDSAATLDNVCKQQMPDVVIREYRFRHADGTYRWMHDEMRVMRDEQGAPREFVGYWLDITARKQSEERDARLAAIVNSSDDAIIGKNLAGIITSWNRGAENMFGYSAAEAVGRPLLMLFPPELAAQEPEILARIARGENVLHFETVRLHRDGRLIDVSVTISPIIDPGGKVVGASKIVRDISARKKAEKLLYENDERLRLALQVSNQGIYDIVNLQTGEIITSPEYARMLGYDPDGFKVTHGQWAEWLHPDDRESVRQTFGRYVADEISEYRVEYRLRTREGNWLWVFSTAKIIERNKDGQPRRILGTLTDISRRKAAEEISQRLMVAIDQSVESLVFTDLQGIILYVNQGFEKVTGYRREEVIGQTTKVLKSDRHPPEFYKDLWETISSGRVWRGRITNRRKDGQIFIEDATISPVRNTRGEITSYVAAKHDVTREMQLERQLIESQKMEAIGQLAGGVAHDYNNILATNMIQLGMLLAEPGLDPEVRESLNALKRGTDRATKLTRQLLMFSRRQAMEKKRMELNALVDEELKMLRRLLGDNLKLVLQVSPAEVWVEADPGMLEQVVMNLCINARDAMPQGGRLVVRVEPVTIAAASLAQHVEARPGQFVRLTVADNGCGMSAETLGHIFEPFFTTKPVGKGTGLGLATVYGIVHQHEGWIEVSSEVGRGSEFRVFLPACPAGLPAVSASTGSGDVSGTETILVVEDEDELKQSVAAYLRASGYRVFVTGNGREALEQWRDQIGVIDVLLTDMVMPGGVNGLELAEALRAIKPGLPVVIMSGYSKEMARAGASLNPGFLFKNKPCEPKELTAALRKVLELSRSGSPGSLPVS